jgi:hypothetical protein
LDAAVETIKADFFWQQGYTGSSVEIGVIDLMMAQSTHPAISGNFRGSQKFVNGAGWVDSHATAVAGAALSQDPARRGVAYNAGWWTAQTTNRGSITSSRTQTVAAETFARGLGTLAGNPTEVLTMSIGFDGTTAATDQWSLGLDHIAATHGTTIVVAAGNAGPAGATLSGPPAGAYNILSVGATGGTGSASSEDYSQIAPYSSRGLTTDGRSKPDLVAPGSMLNLPTITAAGWSVTSGTSFATPLVAGGAALLIDMGGDRGMSTDALVIKSVLMNSADKLTGWTNAATAPLDPVFGAGQMNLQSTYYQYDAGDQGPGSVDTIGWNYGTISAGADNIYNFDMNLPAGSTLTATLVWNRQVSSSTANLENTVYTASPLTNLDLFLYELNDPLIPIASSISTVDNVEHLFLSLPNVGQYALAVRSLVGAVLDPLSYALAWSVVAPEVPPNPLPGDFNSDGVVDAGDYIVWRATDGSQDGYETWRSNFGATIEVNAPESSVAVPEPSRHTLALLAAFGLLFMRPFAQPARCGPVGAVMVMKC